MYAIAFDLIGPEPESMTDLEGEGVVMRDGHRLRGTEEGRPPVRAVAATFGTYLYSGLDSGEQRHSKAV